jgi:DNA-binding MarR family transcriptional regulator
VAEAAANLAATSAANDLLAELARRAGRSRRYEGYLNEVGRSLRLSPAQVSRAMRVLCAQDRVEVLRRGRGQHPTLVEIHDRQPVYGPTRAGPAPLTDRLLAHLQRLSDGGVVEQHLVDVARDLGVGAPSVSRALGKLSEAGLARVDRAGTRNRPTRIELYDGHADPPTKLLGRLRRLEASSSSQEVARLRRQLAAARAEIADLRAQLTRLTSD